MHSFLLSKSAPFFLVSASGSRCRASHVLRTQPFATYSAPSPLQQQATNVALTRNEELLACACSDYEYAAMLSAPVMGLCSYSNGQLVGFQAAVSSMASSVRALLTGGGLGDKVTDGRGFDYDTALQKFGALAYVATDAELSQLALANIRPAITSLTSRCGGVDGSLLLLLKWGQGSKNRHFVDLHCHATALPALEVAAAANAAASPVTIDAYTIPLPSLSTSRSDGARAGIRLSWLDAGVDLSCLCLRSSASGSLVSTSTGTLLAVDSNKAVTMSSGASDVVIRSVRAAAADANLSFRDDALAMRDLTGASCTVIGVRGVARAYNIGKMFEFKNRGLVSLWQQPLPLAQQQHFLFALNTHLASDLERHPIFPPAHPQ